MSTEAVARRYARAAIELAQDENKVAELAKDMRAFLDVYDTSADFRDLGLTLCLTDADRETVVAAIGQRLGAGQTATRTVAMLAARQRLGALPDLVAQLELMADDHLGIVRAHVRSARPLAASYEGRLKSKIEAATKRKVILTVEVDESLIAGLVTQIGDRVIDGSVRGKLNALAESLERVSA